MKHQSFGGATGGGPGGGVGVGVGVGLGVGEGMRAIVSLLVEKKKGAAMAPFVLVWVCVATILAAVVFCAVDVWSVSVGLFS